MRRILMLSAVALVMAAMLMLQAVPAFAEANPENASCVGSIESGAEPGPTKSRAVFAEELGSDFGDYYSDIAQLPTGCGSTGTLDPELPPGLGR